VVAEKTTVCLQLENRDFQAILGKEPLLARRMLRTLARWLRQSGSGAFS
jgi:CRP-like cAMP-binding protein